MVLENAYSEGSSPSCGTHLERGDNDSLLGVFVGFGRNDRIWMRQAENFLRVGRLLIDDLRI